MKKISALISGSLAVAGAFAQQQKPNVVLIYADDIGFGDLSCYGATRVETPNVDALANSGVRFTNAHSCAATSTPSRYGMLTGEYPWRRKGTGIAPGDGHLIIKPHRLTVGKMMQENGYTTAVIGKWHLGLGNERGKQNWNDKVAPGPAEIGFNYSYILPATGDRVPCVFMENQRVVNLDPNDPIEVSYTENFPGEPTGKDNPELLTKQRPSHGHDMSIVNGISRIGFMGGGESALWEDENIADSIAIKSVNFIEKNKEKPFFMYVATHDIHVPRYPHARFQGKTGMGPRGDALLSFDWTVGKIVEALKNAGVYENTIIIISSDNGPVIDDGYQDQAVELLKNHKPAGPFRGGKSSTFEAGTRVPFIVTWGSKLHPLVSNALVSQVDLLATMAELQGTELSADKLDSQPQLSAWLGHDRQGRDYVIGASHSLTVLTSDWKYIEPSNVVAYSEWTNTELGNNPNDQLYDIRHDRGEYDNIADENPLMLRFMKQILEEEKAKGVGMEL